TSSILERVIRAILAAPPVPNVITGMITCSGDPQPVGGNQPRLMANHCISMKPSQKFGIDKPKKATSRIPKSDQQYCRTDEIIIAIRPRNKLNIVLYMDNSKVTQNLGHSSFSTGKLVLQEVPKSSFTAFLTKRKY